MLWINPVYIEIQLFPYSGAIVLIIPYTILDLYYSIFNHRSHANSSTILYTKKTQKVLPCRFLMVKPHVS